MENDTEMDHLPAVSGRRMTKPIWKLEQQCRFLIKTEQEKILPDNHIIDALCECVRLGREFSDHIKGLKRA